MRGDFVIAAIAAGPPTLAAILGYVANSRSIRRSVGSPNGIPLARAIERLDAKVDRILEEHADTRERVARLEGPVGRGRLNARRGSRA